MTLERRFRLLIRRSGAYLLDAVLLAAVLLPIQGLLLWADVNPMERSLRGWPLHGWAFATITGPSWLYFGLLPAFRGATVGHGLLKLHVEGQAGGARPSVGGALLRAAVLLGPYELIHFAVFHGWGWALAAAYAGWALLILSVVRQGEGRGLHDLVGGARVVSGGPRAGAR